MWQKINFLIEVIKFQKRQKKKLLKGIQIITNKSTVQKVNLHVLNVEKCAYQNYINFLNYCIRKVKLSLNTVLSLACNYEFYRRFMIFFRV